MLLLRFTYESQSTCAASGPSRRQRTETFRVHPVQQRFVGLARPPLELARRSVHAQTTPQTPAETLKTASLPRAVESSSSGSTGEMVGEMTGRCAEMVGEREVQLELCSKSCSSRAAFPSMMSTWLVTMVELTGTSGPQPTVGGAGLGVRPHHAARGAGRGRVAGLRAQPQVGLGGPDGVLTRWPG